MLEYLERTEGSSHFFMPLEFTPSIGKFLYLFHGIPTKTCSTFVKFIITDWSPYACLHDIDHGEWT